MDDLDQITAQLASTLETSTQSMADLEKTLDSQLNALLTLGAKKNVGVDIPRLYLSESRKKTFELIVKLLQVEYAKLLIEAKHEQALYDEEMKSRSEVDKPKGFYFPVVRAQKNKNCETIRDGFTISTEWRRYFRVGPVGNQKTMSKSLSRRKSDSRFHLHLFKNAAEWEKEIIDLTEEQLHELRELMKRISTAKRTIVAIRDRYT